MVNSINNSNIKLVKDFFRKNLPDYKVAFESSHGPYWNIKFSNDEIDIVVSGDIGFTVELLIDHSKFELWQYDRSVNEAMKTTDENILYQLNVLKRFLTETQS